MADPKISEGGKMYAAVVEVCVTYIKHPRIAHSRRKEIFKDSGFW
jgi:hypothetical protein